MPNRKNVELQEDVIKQQEENYKRNKFRIVENSCQKTDISKERNITKS